MGNFTLYIGDNCYRCEKIREFIDENNIIVKVINIDKEDYDLPFSLMIIPALVKESKLLAYGPDIVPHLKKTIR